MPPQLPNPLLVLFLLPLVLLVRGIEACRRQWFRLRPREFNWLAMQGVTDRLQDFCGTCACSVQWNYERCRSTELHVVLARAGAFTPETANAIWFRIRPSYVPRELFMRQLHAQMVAQRELFRGSYWQLGCDENGALCLQVTVAAVDTHEPSRRKRATVVRFGMQHDADEPSAVPSRRRSVRSEG